MSTLEISENWKSRPPMVTDSCAPEITVPATRLTTSRPRVNR